MQYSKQYTDYLKSPLWKKRRQAKIEQANGKCQYCGEPDHLQVHHITYEHLGDEQSNELVVLCTAHHWVADEIRKTGNTDLLRKLDKPFQKSQKPKKVKHTISSRKRRSLRRQRKHERKLLDQTLHRDNRRPENGNITRPPMAKSNRAVFISGPNGGKWVATDDLAISMAPKNGNG